MLIKVQKLTDVYPNLDFSLPHTRACALGHAAVDYLRACYLALEHREMGPLFNFLLPTMHQTIELISKAIAFKIDHQFDPKKYSHRVRELLRYYDWTAPVFSRMLSDPRTMTLLEGLENSYLGVRYGECYVGYDLEAIRLFKSRAEELLDDLYARTQVRFLAKHFTP